MLTDVTLLLFLVEEIKQAREIRNFLYSQHFANGLRVSIGAVFPAIVGYYFGSLEVGLMVSLGALMTSTGDTPGLVKHRTNAMLVTIGLIFINTLLTKLISPYPILVSIEIFTLCFSFAMIAVFGVRAAAVGTAAMLMIVLHLHQTHTDISPLQQALYTTLGGVWYAGFSILLTKFMPYRLAQQELAEDIHEVAVFLKIKSTFYDINVDNDKAYKKIIEQQIAINEHQDKLRELLFKSKVTVRDTTKIGRTLILVFSSINDLLEQSMATHYDYNEIQQRFGHTPVFKAFRKVILKLSDELENMSYAININSVPRQKHNFQEDLQQLVDMIEGMERESQENVFILKKILINVRNIVNRINGIYGYFSSQDPQPNVPEANDMIRFVSSQSFGFKLLRDNLSLNSSTFRHALRIAIVMTVGYIFSLQFEFGEHSYWILLTILVILKPGFSLTRQRNFQRLTGTIVGGGVGILILILIQGQAPRFAIMMMMMIGAYSMFRKNYIMGVMFMTPYLLIMYSFLGINTMDAAQERILDTLIGSVLAFTSSYFIFPHWERKNVKTYMDQLLVANYRYLANALDIISHNYQWDITEYKLIRKEVLVSTANLASAFQRMITEPKGKQTNAAELNRFIVYNHLFTSYSANLFETLRQSSSPEQLAGEPVKIIKRTLHQLQSIIPESMPQLPEFAFEESEPSETDLSVNTERALVIEQLHFLHTIGKNIQKAYQALFNPITT